LSDPARGQTLVPGLSVDVADREHVLGQVRFTRFHLGSNGAAHGGAVSLLFDDLLGQLANPLDGPRSRTAWIKVDFRRITPIDRELHIEARTVQRDGRKTVVRGELRDGGDLLAEAEGLFVQLRANQP
jgi:acyl-coenzyme A thioesterase PaaI-like protein